jgi:serine/threonine protein kinase
MQLTQSDHHLARLMLEQGKIDQNGLNQLAYQAEQQGLSFQQMVQRSGLWPVQEQATLADQFVAPQPTPHLQAQQTLVDQFVQPQPSPGFQSQATLADQFVKPQPAPPGADPALATFNFDPSILAPKPSLASHTGDNLPTHVPQGQPAPYPSTAHGTSGSGSTNQVYTPHQPFDPAALTLGDPIAPAPGTHFGSFGSTGMEMGSVTPMASASLNHSIADSHNAIKKVSGALKNLGPYEILGELGRGAMGVVYRAHHARLDRTCALKVLIAGEDASDKSLQRFVAEAQIAVSLDKHPHIVKVLDSGQVDRMCYMAMELVEGKTLQELINAGKVKPKAGVRVIANIADAIEYAHQKGIIHRDIKPDNILIDRTSTCKLNDFGVAKAIQKGGQTMTGAVMGTLAFMAPEQAENSKNVDERSDVYGLGAVLYTVLTKQPPHTGMTSANVMASIMTKDPLRPSEIVPEVDKMLERICLKALARKPAKRFQTAGKLRDALNAYRSGELALLERLVPDEDYSTPKPSAISPKFVLFAGIAAGLFILISGGILLTSGSKPDKVGPAVINNNDGPQDSPELAALKERANDGEFAAMRELGDYYWKGSAGERSAELAKNAKEWFEKIKAEGSELEAAEMDVVLEEITEYETRLTAVNTGVVLGESEDDKIRRLELEDRQRNKENRLKIARETLKETLARGSKSIVGYEDAVKMLENLEKSSKDQDVKILVIAAKSKLKGARALALKSDVDKFLGSVKDLPPQDVLSKIKDLEDFEGDTIAALDPARKAADSKIAADIEEQRKLAAANTANTKKAELERLAKLEEAKEAFEKQKSRIDISVRKAAGKWFKSRSPKKILCRTCKGSREKECSSCGGKGTKKSHSISGGAKAKCKTCDGKGVKECDVGFGGYRKFDLTNAFWKVLPAATKSKMSKKSFIASLISNSCSVDIGVSPVIERATIESVVINEREIIVTANIGWDSEEKRWFKRFQQGRLKDANIFKMTWIRKGRTYYLSTGLIEGDVLLKEN